MTAPRFDMMIDLECCGPAPDGAIVSIGWCVFDIMAEKLGPALFPAEPPGALLYGRFDVKVQSCVDVGMKLDPATMEWWMRQDAEVKALWRSPAAMPLYDALNRINNIYDRHCTPNQSILWAYPATYDLVILDRAYELSNRPRSFGRKEYCCSRSVMKALGYRRSDENIPEPWRQKHLPENDAVRQAIQLQLCMNPRSK